MSLDTLVVLFRLRLLSRNIVRKDGLSFTPGQEK
jgi:hypothetical protein